MFEQRAVDSGSYEFTDRIWRPSEIDIDPERTDKYAAIDELSDGVIILSASDWPIVDMGGRLRFPGETLAIAVEEPDLRDAVFRFREERRDAAWDRPLRIGDVFLLRDMRDSAPATWELIVDVSAAAREAAKIAANAAVTPMFGPTEELPPERDDETQPPPAGPTARPMV